MTRDEALERIGRERRESQHFIKWWSRENDILDYDLIDRFVATAKAGVAVDGFELLDLEGIWQALTALDPDKLSRQGSGSAEEICWVWTDKDGAERTSTYPFTPEGVMTLFDEELFS